VSFYLNKNLAVFRKTFHAGKVLSIITLFFYDAAGG